MRTVLVVLLGLCAIGVNATQGPGRPQRLVAVFVVDGLRPDSINARDTPTIARLRGEGTDVVNSHSVFPTVTRLNAATLATGTYPVRHGIVANSMFVATVNDRAPFDTGDYENLLKLEETTGRAATADTLGEILQRGGRRLVTVSSGSTGNGFLLNPQARHGAGVVIHGLFDRGVTAAYPKEFSDVIVRRFGAPPPDPDDLGQMHWTDGVLRNYVLPELRADVVIDWLGPLDSAQHANGVGSPQALDALRQIDASIGQTIATIEALGLTSRTDIIITSDHGFAHHSEGVNVADALVAAGLKRDRTSTDVVVASQGQSLLFYLPTHEPRAVEGLVRFLQQTAWADVLFTGGGRNGQGAISGTFSLDVIGASHASRAPDIVMSLPWTSAPNAYGAPGSHTINSTTTGPLAGGASGHGGLNPWVVHNTFVAWGVDFKVRARSEAPVSLADVAPTVLAILGIQTADPAGESGRGRILRELLKDAPVSQPTHRVLSTSSGSYRANLEISTVEGHDYVDSGSRQR